MVSPPSSLPTLPAKDLVELVRKEVRRRKRDDMAAYAAFAVLRCPDGSGDWLVQPSFEVPDPDVYALQSAAKVVRKRFRLEPVSTGEDR